MRTPVEVRATKEAWWMFDMFPPRDTSHPANPLGLTVKQMSRVNGYMRRIHGPPPRQRGLNSKKKLLDLIYDRFSDGTVFTSHDIDKTVHSALHLTNTGIATMLRYDRRFEVVDDTVSPVERRVRT